MGTATLFRNVNNRTGSRLLNGPPDVASERMAAADSLLNDAWSQDPDAVLAILSAPCRYRPGTVDKLIVLEWRARLEIDLHIPGDCCNREVRKPSAASCPGPGRKGIASGLSV